MLSRESALYPGLAASSGAAAGGQGGKLRILALHGFRTSAAVLKAQIVLSLGLRKVLEEEGAEVTYLNAPHASSGPAYPEVEAAFEGPYFEWWNAVKADTGEVGSGPKTLPSTPDGKAAPSSSWRYQGMEESLSYLENHIKVHGPYDGLLGFSQGASVSSLVIMLQKEGLRFQDIPKLRFAILIAGGKCRDETYSPLYDHASGSMGSGSNSSREAGSGGGPVPLSHCRTCMMIGDLDPHKGWSEELLPCFEDPVLIRHSQGHVIPRLPQDQLDVFSEWLSKVK